MEIQKIFPMVYCINLKHRVDRWQAAAEEFLKVGVSPSRFDAIKNKANPAAGCRESHLSILEEAKAKNSNVLIFEDDIQFTDGAKIVISDALDELSDLDWAMFYLGGNILKPFHQVSDHLAKLSHCQSTHAYGINKKYLTPIINMVVANKTFIDVIYANGVVPNTNSYITIPMVAIQKADYSNIENRIMTYDIPVSRYNHYFVPLENIK